MVTPKISIIVPVYNVEEYLSDCLDSILMQSFKDFEVICINDGSPDNSGLILKKYSEKDKRLKIITQENKGLSGARNTGINEAIGDYIFFIDSDDLIAKNCLAELYEVAKKKNLDMLFFDIKPQLYDPQYKENYESYLKYYARSKEYSSIYRGERIFLNMRKNHDYLPNAYQYIIKRDLIENNNLKFYEGIIHEDNLFSIQAVFSAKRCSHIKKEIYIRNVREGSIMTNSKAIQKVKGFFVTIKEILKFFEKFDLKPEIKKELSNHVIKDLQSNLIKSLLNADDNDVDIFKKQLDTPDLLLFNLLTTEITILTNRNTILDIQNKKLKKKINKRLDKKENIVINILRNIYKNLIKLKVIKIAFQKTFKFIKFLYKYYKEHLYLFNKHFWNLEKFLFSQKLNKLFQKKPLNNKETFYKNFPSHFDKSKKIKVSVIIPTHNSAKYLQDCIDSLLSQSLKDFELICIDDGSTDKTPQLLENYWQIDDRVEVYLKKKENAGSARNLGLAKAKGEYVIFLDSDDIFDKHLLKKMYRKASSFKTDICICNANTYNEKTKEIKKGHFLNTNIIPSRKTFNKRDIKEELYLFCTPCPWNKIFRTNFLKETHLKFQKVQRANDLFLVYMALTLATRINIVDERLINYRIGIATNLQSKNDETPFEFIKALIKLRDELILRNLFKGYIKKSYINRALSICTYNVKSLKQRKNQYSVKYWLIRKGFQKMDLLNQSKKDYKDYNLRNLKDFFGVKI